MNKILSFACLIAVAFQPAAFARPTVVVATTGEFSPANLSNEQECARLKLDMFPAEGGKKLCGFEIEVIGEACRNEGLNCKWTIVPLGPRAGANELPQILEDLRLEEPKYDLVANFLRGTVVRMKKLNASVSWYEGHPSIYQSRHVQNLIDEGAIVRNANKFPASRDAGGRKLRFAATGLYQEELKTRYTEQELGQIDVIQIASTEEQIRRLNSGEIDFAYGSDVQKAVFSSHGVPTFEEKPRTPLANPVEHGPRVYASPSTKGVRLIGTINRGIANLKASGRLDAILDKYGLKGKWACDNGPRLREFERECEEGPAARAP